MGNTHKSRVLISSINEIRPSLRIKIERVAHVIGLLFSIILVLAFLAFDFFPKEHDWFSFCIDWVLKIVSPLVFYVVGYLFGMNLALWDRGLTLSGRYPVNGDSASLQMNHSNDSCSAYSGYSYDSSVSINPSSGRPMVGSSGIDTYGNPYGTRSW